MVDLEGVVDNFDLFSFLCSPNINSKGGKKNKNELERMKEMNEENVRVYNQWDEKRNIIIIIIITT